MNFIFTTISIALASSLTLQAGSYNGGDLFNGISSGHDGHSHDHSGHADEVFGFNLLDHWFDSSGVHDHSSENRSRLIHPLTVEAAFNDGDFFLDYVFSSFDDEDEHEIEIELEFALTRRLGIILETAYEFENEDGSTDQGFADLAVATRFVLAEFENVITTANIEFQIPTGEEAFSSDELILEPTLLTWFDLGHGFTLNTAIGLEIGTRSNDLEFLFETALLKQLGNGLALTVETRSEVGLRDEERGDISSEGTLGAIYRFNKSTSIRGGWNFPITNSDFNGGAIASFNISF